MDEWLDDGPRLKAAAPPPPPRKPTGRGQPGRGVVWRPGQARTESAVGKAGPFCCWEKAACPARPPGASRSGGAASRPDLPLPGCPLLAPAADSFRWNSKPCNISLPGAGYAVDPGACSAPANLFCFIRRPHLAPKGGRRSRGPALCRPGACRSAPGVPRLRRGIRGGMASEPHSRAHLESIRARRWQLGPVERQPGSGSGIQLPRSHDRTGAAQSLSEAGLKPVCKGSRQKPRRPPPCVFSPSPSFSADPPKKPSIQCFAASYASPINCTWKMETETHLDTSFITTYRHGMDGEEQECVQASSGADSCSIADVQLFSIVPFVLNVTAVNPLGTGTSLFPFLLSQIIKPDPPEDLKVSAIPRVGRKLRLDWKPPSSWLFLEYFPLKYVIRYSRDGTNGSQTTRHCEQTSFVLTGIRPGATYHVQVAAKDDLDNGEYSAWSPPASGTAWRPE